MTTLRCKSFSVRCEADEIILEVAEAQPADLLPRCLRRAEAAERLGISERHLDALVRKHGVKQLPDLPVRYLERDLLALTVHADPPQIVPLPKAPAAPASASPSAPVKPARKTSLTI